MRRLMGRSSVWAFVVGLACIAGPAAAETVEEVGKKIAEATEKLKSFSAKTQMITDMKQEGFSMSTKAEGTTEMMRKGEDFLMRSEMKQVTETNMGGQVNKQEQYVLTITDGQNTYTLTDMGGNKMAQKMKMQKLGKDPFQAWKDTADLKLLPDATVDGRPAWVVQATPKGGAVPGQGATIISFDKETGQMIKMVANGPDGKPLTTMTYSDIKINQDIPAARFEFKAPEGVQVQDMSQG